MLMAVGFHAFWVVVLILRTRAEIAAAKIRTLRMAQVHAGGQTEQA